MKRPQQGGQRKLVYELIMIILCLSSSRFYRIQRFNCCPNMIFINPLVQTVYFVMAVQPEACVPTQVLYLRI